MLTRHITPLCRRNALTQPTRWVSIDIIAHKNVAHQCYADASAQASDALRFCQHAAVATAARLLLAASDWAPMLQRRIEIATPANSLLRFRCQAG